jgi:uncharacterized protein
VSFQEENITIQGKYPLGASITIPNGEEEEKYPAILMIHGTGNVDRNESHPKLKLNAFYELGPVLSPLGYKVPRQQHKRLSSGEQGGSHLYKPFQPRESPSTAENAGFRVMLFVIISPM